MNQLQDVLERRANRLRELVSLSAPKQVICNEVMLILEAAVGYSPDEFAIALTKWLTTLPKNK